MTLDYITAHRRSLTTQSLIFTFIKYGLKYEIKIENCLPAVTERIFRGGGGGGGVESPYPLTLTTDQGRNHCILCLKSLLQHPQLKNSSFLT